MLIVESSPSLNVIRMYSVCNLRLINVILCLHLESCIYHWTTSSITTDQNQTKVRMNARGKLKILIIRLNLWFTINPPPPTRSRRQSQTKAKFSSPGCLLANVSPAPALTYTLLCLPGICCFISF